MLYASCLTFTSHAYGRDRDGFFAYCTSNMDGTGVCVNEEDSSNFICLIVPGQIISCPASNSKSVECIWISNAVAFQAQFWCDPEDEAAIYGDEFQTDSPNN